GRTVAAARLTVALPALDALVELAPLAQDLLGRARRAAERQRLRRLALAEEAREGLEVVDERVPLGAAEQRAPARHRGARHAFVDHAQDVRVRGQPAARRGPDLVE